jgi:hypothetical protein
MGPYELPKTYKVFEDFIPAGPLLAWLVRERDGTK